MKAYKFSFPFSCFIVINILVALNLNTIAQNINDSTLLYYKSIKDIKDVKLTIKSFEFFEKKAEKSLSINALLKAAYYLELISVGQFKMGFLYECESTTIKAFTILDKIKKNPKTIAPRERLSNQLGMLYRKIDDFDNSYKYLNQALILNKNLSDKIAIITNIANNYADQGLYKKATKSLSKHYNEALTLENSSIKATYLDNIGYYQSKTNNLIGLKNMKLALKIRLNLEDLTGLFSSYRHLSLFYSNTNSYQSKKYSEKVKDISNSLNSPIYQQKAMELSLSLENNPDFNKYLQLNTNIEKANLLRENKYAAIKYNVKEKEKIINERELMLKSTELEKEKETKLKLVYLFIGLSILLMSFFLILILKTKHKKDKIQQVYNTETRISKKVHDEVSNDIYHLLTKLQSNPNIQEKFLDDLDDIYIRTRDISKENSIIEVKEDYGDLLTDLLISFKNDEVNILTKNISKIDWNTVEDLKRTTLYRVLQELMINMKKHSKASLVVLNFNQERHKITINYNDNGIGAAIKKGTGLHNVENRMQSINGTIIFETEINKGFKAKITV